MTTQGRERAKDQELQAQRTANRNLRTRVGMLEATLKGCEEKESKKDADPFLGTAGVKADMG